MSKDGGEELFKRALAALRADGLLLKADGVLPSLTTMANGAPVKGSWWSHPKSGAIFRALERLAEHPELVLTKLVAGKDCFVHRRLWPELLAVASDPDPERLDGLPASARALLERLKREGVLEGSALGAGRAPREAVKALELRLLALSSEHHSFKGAHVKRLESWERWGRRSGVKAASVPAARSAFESLLESPRWPWPWPEPAEA